MAIAMAMPSALAFRVGAPPCSFPASPIDLRRQTSGCSALAMPSGSSHVKTPFRFEASTSPPVHCRRASTITTYATGDVLAAGAEVTADPQGPEGTPDQQPASAGPEGAPTPQPLDPIAALKLESDILKKRKKRLELRRKRLKRKRRLRKKGRWPPSKVAKNKNI